MNWHLIFYPRLSDGTDPGDPYSRASDGEFLLACDAVCPCGYVQHPPVGGECPRCGFEGAVDYDDVEVHE